MTITVVDGNNLAGILADAGIEAGDPAALELNAPKGDEQKGDAAAGDAPKGDAAATTEEQDDEDDKEGEDGLTARQKRELSGKMLKAIGKKHRQVKEAEEFAADQIRLRREAEARAAELDRQVKATQKAAEPAKEAVEPKREDFATDAEFLKASIKWGVDEGIRVKDAERAALERQTRMQAQFAKASELVPDFEDVTSKQLNWPAPVRDYLQDSDMFAELGYHFGKNPDDLARIGKLHPVRQLVELGKIEAKLSPFGSSAPKDSSKDGAAKASDGKGDKPAPSAVDTGFSPSKARSDAPVIQPLSSSSSSQVEPDVRDMDVRQTIASWTKANKVNLHARKRH